MGAGLDVCVCSHGCLLNVVHDREHKSPGNYTSFRFRQPEHPDYPAVGPPPGHSSARGQVMIVISLKHLETSQASNACYGRLLAPRSCSTSRRRCRGSVQNPTGGGHVVVYPHHALISRVAHAQSFVFLLSFLLSTSRCAHSEASPSALRSWSF